MVVAVTHECDYPAAATALPRTMSNAVDNGGAPPADTDWRIRRALGSGGFAPPPAGVARTDSLSF
jgi:hypothetical protein